MILRNFTFLIVRYAETLNQILHPSRSGLFMSFTVIQTQKSYRMNISMTQNKINYGQNITVMRDAISSTGRVTGNQLLLLDMFFIFRIDSLSIKAQKLYVG